MVRKRKEQNNEIDQSIKDQVEDFEVSKPNAALDQAFKDTMFKDQTELGQVFDNLDSDTENNAGMSSVDFNARLSSHEISCTIKVDELRSLGILPMHTRITRQKKRLSVSRDGKGREEKVTIASANRGAELAGKSGGLMSSIGNAFKPRTGT